MKPSFSPFKVIVFLSFVSCLFLSSCDKDKEDPEINLTPLLASIVTHTNNGQPDYLQSFQYDNQGRVIKVEDNDGYVSTMEYTASTVTIKDSDDGELKHVSIARLDSKGLCTSMSLDGDDENMTYEYDTDGYRKSSNSESDSWVASVTFTVSEGNYVAIQSTDQWLYVTNQPTNQSLTDNSALTKETRSVKSSFLAANLRKLISPVSRLKSATSSHTNISEFQFLTDKVNTIEYENMGISYMGKQNKNLISKETNTFTFHGEFVPGETITYTYEYDAKGRITKQYSTEWDYSVYTYID